MSKNLWFGYVYVEDKEGVILDNIQVKRYFSEKDTKEVLNSPFTGFCIGPFEANSREEAYDEYKKLFTTVFI